MRFDELDFEPSLIPPPKIRLAMMAMMPAPVPAFAALFFPLDGRGSGPPERTAFFIRDASPRPTATRPPTPSTTRHIPTNNNVDIFPSFYQMTHSGPNLLGSSVYSSCVSFAARVTPKRL